MTAPTTETGVTLENYFVSYLTNRCGFELGEGLDFDPSHLDVHSLADQVPPHVVAFQIHGPQRIDTPSATPQEFNGTVWYTGWFFIEAHRVSILDRCTAENSEKNRRAETNLATVLEDPKVSHVAMFGAGKPVEYVKFRPGFDTFLTFTCVEPA
jgi:hypothetical protein